MYHHINANCNLYLTLDTESNHRPSLCPTWNSENIFILNIYSLGVVQVVVDAAECKQLVTLRRCVPYFDKTISTLPPSLSIKQYTTSSTTYHLPPSTFSLCVSLSNEEQLTILIRSIIVGQYLFEWRWERDVVESQRVSSDVRGEVVSHYHFCPAFLAFVKGALTYLWIQLSLHVPMWT